MGSVLLATQMQPMNVRGL